MDHEPTVPGAARLHPAAAMLVVVVLLVIVVLAACGSGAGDRTSPPSTTAPTSTTAPRTTPAPKPSGSVSSSVPASSSVPLAGDGPITVPDPLPPGEPGTLMASRRLGELGSFPGAITYRVLYHSRSVAGVDIAVSGLVAVPTAAPPTGGRVTLTWGHGTTGVADDCAPSARPGSDAQGDVAAEVALGRGWIFAATDYEGLGTPGRHPHLVGVSEARGMIDIARAARQLPDAHAGDRYVAWGHSQGGHAALFVAQEAPTWAPELRLVAVATNGAPSTLIAAFPLLKDQLDRNDLVLTAVGYAAAYPDLHLSDVMTPAGIDRLGAVDRLCGDDLVDDLADLPTSEMSKGDPAGVASWRTRIEQNEPGTVRSATPLLLVHGQEDTAVPPVAGQILFDRLCGLGQVVDRRLVEDEGHSGSLSATAPEVGAWFAARLAGRPAPNACPVG